MRFIVLLSILIVVFVPEKIFITMVMSCIWVFYTIYYCIKLYNIKDEKIVTNEYSLTPPNNNYSPNIRYLYKGKVDYKVFVAMIIELILKKSISIKRNNNEYYVVDNKLKDEELTKSESFLKNLLFKDIGDTDIVSMNLIHKKCKNNSGYIYHVYKEWAYAFECECAYSKYFKSNKIIIDNSIVYFVVSFILCLYNIFFSKKILIALIIFSVTSSICKYVNDMKCFENEAKIEYKKWLEFKNYIEKEDNMIDECDIATLENYSTYAYVLDSYDSFIKILNKKYNKNKEVFSSSEILTVMNLRIFDYIDSVFKMSINTIKIKTLVFFAKNKGRR